MTTSFLIHTAAVDNSIDLPWDSDERLHIGESPLGRRRRRQLSPWTYCAPSYRYSNNSFMGDLQGKAKVTMLHKSHKENFSKSFADIHRETFLVRDCQNPFLLTRNVSDRLLQENDEDNFYNAIRMNYSSSLKQKRKPYQAHPPVPRNVDNRNPKTSKHLLAMFYGRQTNVRETTDLKNLSDHLCFDDGDDKVYNYSMRSSSLLASSVHPLLRPSLLMFRNRRPSVLSKGRSCHRRGSTTSSSTLGSSDSFGSFTHDSSNGISPSADKKSPSVLGSSLRVLLQTNHHQKVAPTSVSSIKQDSIETIFDNIILNIEKRFGDMDVNEKQVNTTTLNLKEPAGEKDNREPAKEGARATEKAYTDYNRSEASLDFCLLEKPKMKIRAHKRFDDNTPLSIFQPSVSSTQAESSSGMMFLFDPTLSI